MSFTETIWQWVRSKCENLWVTVANSHGAEVSKRPFWYRLSETDKEALRKVAIERRYEAGDFVFHQGDIPTSAFILLSGRLKLITTSRAGQEVLIELRGAGTLIGELGVIDGRPRSTAARTIGPVRALSIPADQFQDLMAQRSPLSMAVLASVAHRLRESVDRRSASSSTGVMTQLCSRLLELSADQPVESDGSVDLRLPVTQQEIADWLGVSRDAVVIALQRLRDDGLIATGRRRIRIIDLRGVEELASAL